MRAFEVPLIIPPSREFPLILVARFMRTDKLVFCMASEQAVINGITVRIIEC